MQTAIVILLLNGLTRLSNRDCLVQSGRPLFLPVVPISIFQILIKLQFCTESWDDRHIHGLLRDILAGD
jgi:hypothetical protein